MHTNILALKPVKKDHFQLETNKLQGFPLTYIKDTLLNFSDVPVIKNCYTSNKQIIHLVVFIYRYALPH